MKRSFRAARDGARGSGADESSGKASDGMLWTVTCLANVKLGSGKERKEKERGKGETSGEKGKEQRREDVEWMKGGWIHQSTECFKGQRDNREQNVLLLDSQESLRRFLRILCKL